MNSCLRVGTIIAAIFAFPWGALADQTSRSRTVTCEGPFARDTSHAKLAAALGAANVVSEEVAVAEGIKLVTVVYPTDPRRRLEIVWKDETRQRHLAAISISREAEWTAGRDVKLGMTLAQIEALNGKPFQILDFETDGGGAVMDWQGGALKWVAGGCVMGMRFGPDSQAPPSAFEKIAGQDLFSNNPDVGALKLRVIEIFVNNPS
jgi:hypothetical protein